MRSKFKWILALLVAFTMQFSFAQDKTVTGVVSDDSGPLPGANVVVKGTTRGVQTDLDGKYSIQTKVGETLVYSFIGLDDQSKAVGAANTMNVKLSQANVKLEEVVVQGYRNVSKKSAVTAKASVDARTIENRPNANAINTLQGQLAGVNITASTGQPGAKSTVLIRGSGTYGANTDPLYVIDGFPSNSDNFRSINPNDIASVDVLKDAAAITEYGSRGSNGVIVIKTKKGNFGDAKTVFRFSSQYGVSELQKPKYDYASSKELLKIEQNAGAGLGGTLTDAQIDAWNIDTNWVDYFFQKGISTSNNFSIENSSKNLNAFTSVSYFKQEGVLRTTGLQRFTIRNNVNGKSNNEKFKYAFNTAVGYSKNNEATSLGTGAVNRNYVLGAYASNPYISPDQYSTSLQLYNDYQADGTLLLTPLFLVDKLATYDNLTEETRLDVASEVSYEFAKGLVGRMRTGGQLLTTRFFQAEYPDSFNALLFSSTVGVPSTAGGNFNGFEDINQRREFLFNNLFQVDYTKTYKKHTINAVVSQEYNYSTFSADNQRQRGLNPLTFVPNTGAGYVADIATHDFYGPQASAGRLKLNMMSYFASLDYDFNKKYGIVFSGRQDKSSRFSRTDFNAKEFWSIGARWNLDEEGFMQSLDFINSLKLRGSIGTVGNQRVVDGTIYAGLNPPLFADTYATANNVYNNGIGYAITFADPTIRWETTKQWNAGMDWEFFSNRFRGSFDVYSKKTVELYIDSPTIPASGTTTIRQNGDMFVRNDGVELSLFLDLIRNENMKLTLRGNGAYNRQTAGRVPNGRIIAGTQPSYITADGGQVEEFYVYHTIGVNPLNGELLFEDANGNATETPTAADLKGSGKTNLPQYFGGFGFDFEYKGFFASTLFTYAAKVWRYDADLDTLYDPSNLGQFTVTSDLLNAWTPTNTGSQVPALTAANLAASGDSDRFIKDASFVRLRNAQLGYRVPKKLLAGTMFSDLSLTLQGENLFNHTKWQGFDPESDRTLDQYQYPTPKIYTLGLDVRF